MRDRLKKTFYRLLDPLVGILQRIGATPDGVTWGGLVLSIAAGVAFAAGWFGWGALVLAAAGCCDALDGRLARRSGTGSPAGAYLDSSLDRVGEVAVFAGLAWYAGGAPPAAIAWGAGRPTAALLVVALGGSLMVSYTRARAEGLGVACTEGRMQRPERLLVLIAGSLIAAAAARPLAVIQVTAAVLAATAWWTAAHRLRTVRRRLQL